MSKVSTINTEIHRKRLWTVAALTALLIGSLAFYSGYVIGSPISSAVIEPGTQVETVSYTIFGDSGTFYAKNGTTGAIEYPSTNPTTVIHSARDMLTAGRTWKETIVVIGDIIVPSKITLDGYINFVISGALTLANDVNDDLIQVTGSEVYIVGGELSGNKANNNAGSGISVESGGNYFRIDGISIHDFKENGIEVSSCYFGEISQVYCSSNDGDGVLLHTSAHENSIRGGHCQLNGGDGLHVTTGTTNLRVFGGDYGSNMGYGIHLENVKSVGIKGVWLENNGKHHIYLNATTSPYCQDNLIENIYSTGRHEGYRDIYIDHAQRTYLTANRVEDDMEITVNAENTQIDSGNYGTIINNSPSTIFTANPEGEASYIIWERDSTYYVKNGTTGAIDYSGTNAAQIIQNVWDVAIGNVLIKAGDYELDSFLTMRSGVYTYGEGEETNLYQKDGANINQLIRGEAISFCGLFNLLIDYNYDNNPSTVEGMHIDPMSFYVTIERCTFKNAKGFAISFTGNATSRNNHINILYNNILQPESNPNDMLLVVSDYAIVKGNRLVGINANGGLVIYESDHASVSYNEVELSGGGYGISLMSCRYTTLAHNKVTGDTGGTAYQIITEHDNPESTQSERNYWEGNTAYNVYSGIQLVETNYDLMYGGRIDYAINGIEFPNSTYPDASWLIMQGMWFLNVNFTILNTAEASNIYFYNFMNGTTWVDSYP